MKRKIPYSEQELRVVGEIPGFFGGPGIPIRNTPVSPRENFQALYYEKTPYWMPTPFDCGMMMDPLYNNSLGRGGPEGTIDSFGINWVWVESAGGSIVHPGEPFLANANEWKDKIKFPDLDTWDWAQIAKDFPVDTTRSCVVSLVNGFWFERLISFMDFAPAAIALVDEDQQGAVKELFEATTDFACKVVDKYCEYFPAIDIINVHDDWGSQKDAFFSEAIAREYFLPHMKDLTRHIHSKGRIATLHSCGHVENRVQVFIEGGWDEWEPQTMNNTQKLYDDWGDQIVIAVNPDPIAPDATESEQRQKAREFVDRFANPGKPMMVSGWLMPPAFNEEIYVYSRKKFAAM